MKKILLSSLMLLSSAAYADNTPTFDFATGVLKMPYVTSSQGVFNVTLTLVGDTFQLTTVTPSAALNDTTTPPSFDFATGVLKLPKINSAQGTYTANLQYTQNAFSLTSVAPVSSEPAPTPGGTTTCRLFPADNVWNTRIDGLPLHPRSDAWINTIKADGVRTDFGADFDGGPFGQPINLVNGSQVSKSTFTFQIPTESDKEPYPVPANPLLERTDEPRLLIVDVETCKLYETYNAKKTGNQWSAKRGAVWNMNSNALRPLGWAAADEGGFPTVPGLVRYDEVTSGSINHALRFTFPKSNTALWPARHVVGNYAPINDTLPMGARLRLKDAFNVEAFDSKTRVILQAMKTYGIMLADDGRSLMLSGTPDNRWDNDLLGNLRRVKGSDFEVVDSECMMINIDSGQAKPQC